MSNSHSGLVLAERGASYPSGSDQERWVEVLVDSQWTPQEQQQEAQLYTYRLPPDIEVHPGDILTVPFGAQQMGAIAIRLLDSPPSNLDPAIKIKEVEDVQSAAFFQPSYWQLLERVAQYYCTPLMWVIRGALPPGLLRSSQRRIRLKKAAIPDKGADTFVSPMARQILNLLESQTEGDYSWQYIQRQIRGATRGLRELLKRGWVESYMEPPKTAQPKLQKAVTLATT